ncbi:MAG: NAD-binding protein [Candidatus Omnitrophica bacterium]|nr:NAD-binding protein [Candidatus Omnitrophota bacterium]
MSQKQGVFHLKTYADAGKAVDYLGLTEIAVVEVDNIIALQSACHLRNLGKETIVVVPSDHLLSDILDKDVADYLTEQLQRLGVRFVFNNGIVEVLGDGEAKAIRLKTGKVLESQMVVFSQADKNLSLLNTDDLLKEETDYFIKYEDVYCAKDLKSHLDRSIWEDFFIGRYALGGQGKNIAAAFFKQPNSFIEAPLERSFDLEGLSVALLGSAKRNDHTVAYMKVDYRMDAYKKIFVQEEVVKGAALINHQADAGALVQLINDQKSIKGIGMSVVDYPRTA